MILDFMIFINPLTCGEQGTKLRNHQKYFFQTANVKKSLMRRGMLLSIHRVERI